VEPIAPTGTITTDRANPTRSQGVAIGVFPTYDHCDAGNKKHSISRIGNSIVDYLHPAKRER
jgi:hypothetical protein